MSFKYPLTFYNERSSALILPHLFKIVKPNTILDIGCGIGTWLSMAKKFGVKNVLGVDGEYVDRNLLRKYLVDDEFVSHDLTMPLELRRRFDLCFCLEVAEHLPKEFSDVLVDTLVRHSDLILFSAAIPGQGGENHLNEQEPNFWIKKFENKGYHVYDPIRPLVWTNKEVDVWYKQNIFLFSKNPMDLLKPIFTHLVHPELYQIALKKKIQYKSELEMIKSGKASFGFYLKRFLMSLFS